MNNINFLITISMHNLREKVMRTGKMISKRKLILCQILSANTLRKTMEHSLGNLYVDGLNG